MKNKKSKTSDVDVIVEELDKVFNVSIVEQNNDFNIYKIGIFLNGLEINNNEIELNTVDDKVEKLKRYMATSILKKLKENRKEIVIGEKLVKTGGIRELLGFIEENTMIDISKLKEKEIKEMENNFITIKAVIEDE